MEIAEKLPCELKAERVVLAAIFAGHPQTSELFEMLTSEDFFDSRNRVIFSTLQELWGKSKSVELPSVHDCLSNQRNLETAGGSIYVASIGDDVLPSKSRADRYAVALKEARARRDLIKACNRFGELAQTEPLSELFDKVRETVSSLEEVVRISDSGVPLAGVAKQLMTELREPNVPCLVTGLPEVDDNTGGFRAGEIGILTADTGAGKTFFALQIARKSCAAGRHLLYCSGEMLASHLLSRVLASESQIPYRKLRNPQLLNDTEYVYLMDLAEKQCPDCRVIDGELTLPRIRLGARAQRIGGLIVDYDELVESPGKDEWEEQRVLVRSLKSLAMELRIPVLIVSQLRKALNPEERKNPSLQRLYGSGAKAKHASIVLYVDRPFVRTLTGDETEATVYTLKSRDGRMGKTDCQFNVRTLSFEQCPKSRKKKEAEEDEPS